MDVSKLAERLMRMDDAAWARHANPWSGWSRVTVLPLLALAIWSRAWLGWYALVPVAAVLAWAWLNPRLFAQPHDAGTWMTRGVLGERIWLARETRPVPGHHAPVVRALTVASALGLPLAAAGLLVYDVGLVLAGLTLAMGAKLWFLDRMVWLRAEVEAGKGAPGVTPTRG